MERRTEQCKANKYKAALVLDLTGGTIKDVNSNSVGIIQFFIPNKLTVRASSTFVIELRVFSLGLGADVNAQIKECG